MSIMEPVGLVKRRSWSPGCNPAGSFLPRNKVRPGSLVRDFRVAAAVRRLRIPPIQVERITPPGRSVLQPPQRTLRFGRKEDGALDGKTPDWNQLLWFLLVLILLGGTFTATVTVGG
jgi:hypothetical protein